MLDRILRNWPLKLLALGLAFAVWVAITGENRILVDYKVPVAVVLPPDRLLTKPPPTTVSVQLRGPEPILRGIDSTDLSLRLDLRDAGVGDRSVRFSSADVKGVPRGIDIMRFEPDHLAVSVAERTRRTIPVAPSFTDKPPRGYALYGAQAFPEALEVDGPGSEVGALARLRTDPISLGQRTAPFTVRVGAVSDSANVRVVDPRPVEVHAVVDVAPVESRFDPVPVVVAGQVSAASASPGTVAVVLSGPPEVLGRIVRGQIRAVADASGLAPRAEPYHLSLRAELTGVAPDDLARITIKSMSRAEVDVILPERNPSR